MNRALAQPNQVTRYGLSFMQPRFSPSELYATDTVEALGGIAGACGIYGKTGVVFMLKVMSCTCGNRLVRGQLERPHEPDCACAWAPVRPVKKHGDGPVASGKQLAFLRRLKVPVESGLTAKAADRRINQVLKRKARH